MKKHIAILGIALGLIASYVFLYMPTNLYAQENETNCFDNIDNDDDLFVDFADSDCEGSLPYENSYDRCHDDIDNDDNGFVDYADEGCQPFINLKVKNHVQKHIQKKNIFTPSSLEYVQCKNAEKKNIKIKSDRCHEKNGK